MTVIFLSMFATMAALMLFNAIVLFGGLLVRRLRLPTDLPFDLLFTAPPPPMNTNGNRQQAAEIAAQQALDQHVFDQAKLVYGYLFECEAAAKELSSWDHQQAQSAHKKLKILVRNQRKDQEHMDSVIKNGQILDQREHILKLNDRYADSHAELEAILSDLPQPGIKRILILTVLLILCTGMLFIAHMLSQQ